MANSVDNLGERAIAALTAVWQEAAAFVPNLLAALVILVIGYVASRIAASIIRRMLTALGFERLSERIGIGRALQRMEVTKTASHIVGRLVFWILMLTFLLSAAETLGLERLSATIDGLVQYLPKVLGAAFVLAVGLLAATFARDAVRAGANAAGSTHAQALGQVTYALLAVVAGTLAIGQLEIETALLTVALGVVIGTAGGAAALAFGMGSREVAANVLAGAYLRDNYPPGTRIAVDDIEGTIRAVEGLGTVIETTTGEVTLPNTTLVRERVRVGPRDDLS